MPGRWIEHAATVCAAGMLAVCALGFGTQKPRTIGVVVKPALHTPKVTFTRDVAPILYQNCTECHRDGEVAPFALVTYDDAAKRAHLLASVTETRYMPPWKADPQPCAFVGQRRLTDAQIAVIKSWADENAPQGNPGDLPKLPDYPVGWDLGKPDEMLQPAAPYHLAGDGSDVYRCFVIPTNISEDKFLSAVEIHPGNGRVVHHVIAYIDTTGTAMRLAGNDPSHSYTSFGGPGFTPSGALGGWVPGYNNARLADGLGIFLPANSDIVLQVHYHKDGKPETDLTKIGLYYTTAPVDKRVRNLMLINPFIDIPAGAPNYEAQASFTVPEDITVLGVTPHMHWLGHDMTVTANRPNGSSLQLVHVPNWDFNWQLRYLYQDPFQLPKGSVLHLTTHYDNTAANPRNPNTPPQEVTWGEQTTDEMCIAFVTYTVDSEHLTQNQPAQDSGLEGAALRREFAQDLMIEFDANHDGYLDNGEVQYMIGWIAADLPGRKGDANRPAYQINTERAADRLITFFDKDGDGKLSVDELSDALDSLNALRN